VNRSIDNCQEEQVEISKVEMASKQDRALMNKEHVLIS
jgi:hypothetical protein